MSTAWSYSSIKTFDQCPRKYYHLKVLKDVKDSGNEATIYGQEVHKACEDYVKDDVEIPEKFAYVRGVVEAIKRMDGDKHTELKLGVKKVEDGYEPCKFLGKDVWWRGIADVVVIRGDTGYSLDYKTSKNARYADTKQLDLVAAGLFVHFPQLKKVKSGLLFVVSNEFIHKEHFVEQRDDYFDTFKDELDRLDTAEVSGVWNAKTGPLCKFCPVTRCEHNRKG
jgi:CRISPR/Cas system-associated exonuclease Cas4 (RecB family)